MEWRRRCLHGLKVRQWAPWGEWREPALEVQSRWIFFPFIIHWKLSEESEHSVLSAPPLWYKTGRMAQSPAPCRILRFFFPTFFFGDKRGNISIAFLSRNPSLTTWRILFISSPVFYTSRQSVNVQLYRKAASRLGCNVWSHASKKAQCGKNPNFTLF